MRHFQFKFLIQFVEPILALMSIIQFQELGKFNYQPIKFLKLIQSNFQLSNSRKIDTKSHLPLSNSPKKKSFMIRQ